MKQLGEAIIKSRCSLLSAILFVGLFTTIAVGVRADIDSLDTRVVTNSSQLAEEAFSGWCSVYLPDTAWQWQAYSTDGGLPWWIDCSQWPCLDLSPTSTNVNGVSMFAARLTKNVLTGETIFQSDNATNVLAHIEAPSDYQPGAKVEDRGVWYMWQQMTNCPDCWGIEGEVPPPTVSLKVFLADVQNKPTWDEAVAAQEAAWEEAQAEAGLTTSGTFSATTEDDGGVGVDSACTITNEAAPFVVLSIVRGTNGYTTVTWESCSDHIYGVLSTDQLSPSTVYTGRAAMWGLDGSTSWTDATTTNVNTRFYKIVRMPPGGDNDNDGLSNAYEVQYGLDPLNAADATGDSDGDGYSNWDEALMGTNPTATNDLFTVYVDSVNTNGLWDGTQAHPFRYIQDAMQCSVSVNSNLAIRVRPGIYYETVSNLQFDFDGYMLSKRNFVYIYAANSDWSLSVDPETHLIDSSGLPNGDMLGNSSAPLAPAVQFYDVTQARLSGFTIRNGWGENAGGIECISTQGVVTVSNCIIEKNGNPNTTLAGGILLWALPGSLVYNTVIAKNVGQVGGILDFDGSHIWNSTIVSNMDTASGVGGIYGYFAFPNVRDCVAWGNGLDLYAVDVDYSVVGSNEFVTAGSHNLTNEPILVNTAFGNYRLQTNSPVRGVGISLPVEQRDLYGNSRPVTGSFDIGANQYKDSLGDGIQDDWKIKHSLSLTVSQASLNFDGDTLNNFQEYNLNTDPNNPDTDGDGIPDNLDPDPTTPEEAITAEFHAFFRQGIWQYYINGITSPDRINLPPTQPRIFKLTNYHIGDQFNIQAKYVSGPTNEIIYFLVPLQSTGAFSVLPDANATPLQHFTEGAPLGDLVPPGGWTTTVWTAILTNFAGPCGGFDDETPKYVNFTHKAISVPQNGSNSVNVLVFPTNVANQVSFESSQSFVTLSPSQANSATQLLQVAGVTSGTNIQSAYFVVWGVGAQNSYTNAGATADVDVLPMGSNVTVAIYAVGSTGEPSTTPTNAPTQAQLKTYFDTVFGKQANVFINVLPLVSTNVNYDLNTNTNMDLANGSFLSDEMKAVTNAGYVAGAFNVYYVHAINPPILNGIAFGPPLNTIFIRDDHWNSAANLTAHEVGHLFNVFVMKDVPEHTWGTDERLMFGSDLPSNPCRLVRYEWTEINNRAQ